MYSYLFGKEARNVCRQAVKCILAVNEGKLRNACERVKMSDYGLAEVDKRGLGMSVIFNVNLNFLL